MRMDLIPSRLEKHASGEAGGGVGCSTGYGTGYSLLRAAILACLLGASGLPPALAAAPSAGAATPPRDAVTASRDLATAGREAADKGLPVLLLFSRADCRWCAKVRREYLRPLARETPPRAVIREVRIDTGSALLDFAGRRTTSADFARRYRAHFAPTVMFLDAQGQPLGPPEADPIVGFRTADFYGAYLERALDAAHHSIAQLAPPAQAGLAAHGEPLQGHTR